MSCVRLDLALGDKAHSLTLLRWRSRRADGNERYWAASGWILALGDKAHSLTLLR